MWSTSHHYSWLLYGRSEGGEIVMKWLQGEGKKLWGERRENLLLLAVSNGGG